MFICKTGGEVMLREVYIPTLCKNIISLGHLSESGNKVVLSGTYLWVNDQKGRLLMKVKRSANRLYKIILESRNAACLVSNIEESTWIWHSYLGHVNFKAVMHLSDKGMARGIPKLVQPNTICTACLLTKQTRNPFPTKAEFQETRILELVHADFCGPIAPTKKGETEKILVSRDVVFEETRVLKWDQQQQDIQVARSSPVMVNIGLTKKNTEDGSNSYGNGATGRDNKESEGANNTSGSGTVSPHAAYQAQARIQEAAAINPENTDFLGKYMMKLKK
ncbi:hypothetical protein AgCh_002522 [Apium graveolens]